MDRVLLGRVEHGAGQSPPVPRWSFTKTILAAAALALVGQKRLSLDEPIDGKPYSLRHLLQHTSGLPDYGGLPEYHAAVAAGQMPWSGEELLSRVKSRQLLFSPGTSWAYSNVGYLMVRQILERAFDGDVHHAIRTLVFTPAGAHIHRDVCTRTRFNCVGQ